MPCPQFHSRSNGKLSPVSPPRRIIFMKMNDCTNNERPITEERLNRMRTVLRRRQPDLTVVLENVHDPHNISAVLRSCDAVGVFRVHLVYTFEEEPQLSKDVSASALKWLEIERHNSIHDCYSRLRTDGFRILATALREECLDLHELDLTVPTAFVFGNEMRGCSDEAVDEADGTMLIPMMGMVQSLNISVACAVTLYEALRQRRVSGGYDTPKLSASVRRERLDYWLRRDRRAPLSDMEPV
jgi:tRNA (guanosine-2'-O-)-methyltransferase